ncbi:MAG: sugar phosphate isomerase/epimerase family protein [Armatimonadia bacterium]
MTTYAISTWLVGHVPTDEAIRLMADSGFTRTELSADWAPIVIAWEQDPVAVCAQLAAAGISVPSVHSPEMGRRLDLPDSHERLASIQDNIRYFGLMQACGIPEIIIHPVSGAAGQDGAAWAEVPGRVRESLKTLAEAAGNAGIRLAVENLAVTGRPGSTMASILEMIDGLGDHVGLCMDIGHSQQAHLDLLDELSVALSSGKLLTLHLHDVDPAGKDHYIPGEGCLDFEPYLGMLRAHGYDGGRTLEIAAAPAEIVAERIRQAAEARERWQASDSR